VNKMTDNKQYEEAFEVEFEIVNDNSSDNDRIIRGEPLYYTTGQVAEMLGESDSTIRFWCNEFDEFLKIEKTGPSGKRRQFTSTDIKKLEYIKYLLKEENLSIKQVKEFLSSPEAEKMQPITKEKQKILIEALANAIASQIEESIEKRMDKLINDKLNYIENILIESAKVYAKNQENFIKSLLESQNKFKEDLLKETAKTTAKTIAKQLLYEQEKMTEELTKVVRAESQKYIDELAETKKAFQEHLSEREKALLERDKEIIEEIRKRMEERKIAEEKPRGFFSRIFGRQK